MITGVVNAFGEAIIHLQIRGELGGERQIDALIDTGFTGMLTLPPSLIEELGLFWQRRGRALLADGSETVFDIYEATIIWDGTPCRVAVDAVDADPLVGMSLLQGYEMTMQIVEGGRVVIQSISRSSA
jgi:clan AA aspartic protease